MNYVTQSAVSQAISKLETIFGVQLIIHNKQKLIVTDQGQIVFNHAPQVFKSVKEIFDQVNLVKDEVSGILKFATTKSLGMSFLAPTYAKINEKLPLLKLKFDMGGKNFIRTAIKREDIEFAIVVYDHNFSQFAKQTIRKGKFNLYQSKKAPKNLIEKGIFIDEKEGMYIHALNDFCMKKGYLFETKEIAGWELVAHFAGLGYGVGFFPDYIAAGNRHPNLNVHPLKLPLFEYEIAAIYNKTTKLSKAAQAFIGQFALDLT